ncbi:hypothetical protein A8H39_01975 [Paraburkholderia fungorum]|uniref:hypothetical protein n=1 Tax=Paraburkholderia fungorum TaxID=134537 RepID=UPI0004849DE9|nr:hypothetical protein [Paraburkholderia fungorum]MBB5546583.1 hypothetical protein [Paraburkholderia fungorum]PNE59939.1 hypothetical protein A8H39_01975 [Paraburkholderia fungorum]
MNSNVTNGKLSPTSQTVYCVAVEGGAVGGVDWYRDASRRAEKHRGEKDVWFDLDVPENSSKDEITALADHAAWGKWYDAGRLDCRRVSRTITFEPGTAVEVEFHGKAMIGIVKADFNAVNKVPVDIAGTVYGFHDTQILRTMTSRVLAERYPVKGSMPLAVVHQLYQLREAEIERLTHRDVIVAPDLQGLDRGARFLVAATLFEKCDDAARQALLYDEHPHVRSCAVIAQSDLATVS